MATVQSMVEHKSLIIDDTSFIETGDKVYINGHFYSDKPFFASFLGAIIYAPLYWLGIKLTADFNLAYYLITLFTVKLFYFFGLLAFYEILERIKINQNHRYWMVFSLAFASLFFPWATTFNNHLLAASFLIIGLKYLLNSREGPTIKLIILSGMFFSMAGAVDLPMIIFYLGFYIYILTIPELRKFSFFYIVPSFFTILPTFIIFYQVSESFLPLTANIDAFIYPETPWVGKKFEELTGRGINKGWFLINYSFHSLLGTNGFILYNPLLFLAIPNLIKEIKQRKPFWREGIVIGAGTLIVTLFYLLSSTNYSGNSYSIRWFVPFLPMLFIFLYPIFDDSKKILFYRLLILSILISAVGTFAPWSNIEDIHKIPFLANIIEMSNLLEFIINFSTN
ncbi:MAG: hypothetical protein HOF10_03935 [Chloroflexi bacterium]|nr:hypothetical protein [Chloroflexota bacterium]MBT4304467.1 hypothetical protein [Chloroflexota bacterium]MBT5337403.1 hypothetical protein [Chloroflexota bacterium]MBT6988978.1 hypothetical protein [Chloroflexota bacterium]